MGDSPSQVAVMVWLLGIALCVSARGDAEKLPIAPKERWEDLGVPVRRCRIYSRAVGRDATGREILYFGFSDAEVFVLALDPRTGQGRQLNLLGRGGQVWGLCAHSNGKAYASIGKGDIFELDAASGEVRLLGRAPEGEQVVWELWEAADGNLYGGTYPRAKLVRVNTATGAIEDLGRMDPDQMYVRTAATQGEFVYCGCGVTKPAVWAYHIGTGEKTQLLPDEARKGPGWGRAFKRSDGNIYIYGTGGAVYRVTGLQIEKVPEMPAAPHLQLADGSRIFAYDQAGPDRTYLLVTPKGERKDVRFDYTSCGTPLWDLIAGPDGRIYGNTHTPIALFAFDPKTKTTQIYGDPVGHAGQIYSWMWRKGCLHMAAYSECTYTVWDPGRPWRFGADPNSNPRRLGSTSRHIQRASGMMCAPDGRHVIVGGAPGYGRTGGGIAIVDPDKVTFDVIEHPCGMHSPSRLSDTPDPAVIAIGTSTYGGTGSKQAITPARLVLWDWQRRQTVRELTPWEDEIVISGLLRIGDELFLCGAPHGKIAVYDLQKGEITHKDDYGYGAGRLRLRESDGRIYSAMRGRIVRIDPTTRRHEVLGTYPDLETAIAISGDYLYGFEGTHLLRFKLD